MDLLHGGIANGFGGDLNIRHRHGYTGLANEFGHSHPDLERDAVHDAEQAFDRLNPDYGSRRPAQPLWPPSRA